MFTHAAIILALALAPAGAESGSAPAPRVTVKKKSEKSEKGAKAAKAKAKAEVEQAEFAPPATVPFAPPRLVAVTDETRCDTGIVKEVDAQQGVLKLETAAGIVTYQYTEAVHVIGPDSKSIGNPDKLTPGGTVRVYYTVDDGAKVLEVDFD